MTGAGPGKRIATGRLRVDAARAVSKLREFQLLDRKLWILEGLRAAVGAGATAIRVDGDADDVWLAWDGPPPASDAIGALLDELVSPTTDASKRWIRLLATSVNTALGEGTRYVDVWRIDGEETTGFRYQPSLLVERAYDEEALRPLRRDERIAAPPSILHGSENTATAGVLVHVRRRFGGDVLGRWLRRAEPPEISLLREVGAGRRSRVPLIVCGKDLGTVDEGSTLIALPIRDNALLALHDPLPWTAGPRGVAVEYAELGVPLAVRELEHKDLLAGPVPVTLFYDADRLPTNAARSMVREEERGLGMVLEEAAKAVPKLVEKTTETFSAMELDDPRRDRLRRAILAWIAAHIAGPHWTATVLPRDLQPLRELELARDAIGRWLPLSSMDRLMVHRDDEPADLALKPWVGRSLFLPPGEPAELLLGGALAETTREKIRVGNRVLGARRRWEKHAQRAAVIEDANGQWLSVRFGRDHVLGDSVLPLKKFAERYEGEVCLLDPSAVRSSRKHVGGITLLYGGRPLSRVDVVFPVPFEAVIAAEALNPTDDYRDAKDTRAKANAIRAVELFAQRAVEAVLTKMAHPKRRLPRSIRVRGRIDARQHREALGEVATMAVPTATRKSQAQSRHDKLVGPLFEAPIFEIHEADEHRPVSAQELLTAFQKQDAILVLASPKHSPPRGRLAVSSASTATFLTQLYPNLKRIHYDPGIATRRPRAAEDLMEMVRPSSQWPALRFELEGARGAISWGAVKSTLLQLHRGAWIRRVDYAQTVVPCSIVLDDDGLVPAEAFWDDVALPATERRDLAAVERELLRAVIDHTAGEHVNVNVKGMTAGAALERSAPLRDTLVAAAAADPSILKDEKRREALSSFR